MPKLLARCLVPILFACLGLAGCRREVLAPGDPVAAVKGLADALKDNDLVRYSRLSMPPALHRRMELRWQSQLSAAAPPSAAEQRDYARWMARLTAADAEKNLYRDFNAKLRKVEAELTEQWPLMQATGGIFINGLVQANDKLSPAEKAHAKAVGTAVLGWLTPALLSDRDRARQAIALLSATARQLDLPTLEQSRQLGMIAALEKGDRVLKAAKQIGRIYGLDADASLAAVQARVIALDGDLATMEISYPLLGKTVKFDWQLIRREQRWYSADAVQGAERELLQPLIVARPTITP